MIIGTLLSEAPSGHLLRAISDRFDRWARLQFGESINRCGIISRSWYHFELRERSLDVLTLTSAGVAPSQPPDCSPNLPLQ